LEDQLSYRNDNGQTVAMVNALKAHLEEMTVAVENKEFSANTGIIVIDMLLEQQEAIAKTGANLDMVLPLIEAFKAAKARISVVYAKEN
jgi:hypothetical protein